MEVSQSIQAIIKNIIWVVYKQEKFISHNSGDLKVQDHDINNLKPSEDLLSH